jgi:hypothetical protein
VQPVCGIVNLLINGPDDVAAIISLARDLDGDAVRNWRGQDGNIARDLGDYLAWLSGTHPDWFAPYADEVATELTGVFRFGIDDATMLFAGATDATVDRLASRLKDDPFSSQSAELVVLAGIGSPYAMHVLAERARPVSRWCCDLNSWGIDVPVEDGPAIRRFVPDRWALFAAGDGDPIDGYLGLPLDEVTSSAEVTWHYLSVEHERVNGLPPWPHRAIHILAPNADCFELSASTDESGRFVDVVISERDDYESDGDNDACTTRTTLTMRPYDDSLTYRNGHVQLTPGLLGTVGGPPVGIYPVPICRSCGRLMFHIATITSHAREYGVGFRSVFTCSECVIAAVSGTHWN